MEDTQGHEDRPPVKYDYSHLRDRDKNKHWYSTPAQPHPDASLQQPLPPPLTNKPGSSEAPTLLDNAPAAPQTGADLPPPPVPRPRPGAEAAPSKIRQRVDQRRKRRAAGMPENWAWVVIASALLGLTIIGSLFLAVVIRYSLQNDNDQRVMASGPVIEPTSIIYSGESGTAVGGALEGNSLEILERKWDGRERFTVLLMGLDKRPGEEGSMFRTDTMILVSLDPQTNSIGMLSIPRDTYVEIPFCGLQRINAAYVCGELEEPGSGPRVAMQTVQYNFGIRVNDYVTVDFLSVIDLVDAIGGIDVEVQNYIYDAAYPTMDYGTEVLEIEPGWHHFDGEMALKFARTRHSSDDIDRAQRQQQVIYAVRDRVTSLDMVDDLVLQAPTLYAELRSGIDTGLSLDQLAALALWVEDVPRENIRNSVLSWDYLLGYQTEGGANVLVPDRSKIGQLMVEVFGENYAQ